ncbi:hercynylcysteine sulfoxide lyase [Streptomyces sp. RB5]|uniref:Hercynylcysteine sulfoxide lyase n=1 Tax=Streptomyces smaragdinus TaxID=2585196 RepID=A0A7K0CFP7_9ACTN|nr:aminotransferase class V-fold PLP-dependent enzyme [Streptomyces smaragdinus]MQY12299.1 hercynylcysteine sulfoxide lyase [Streptomyces smaragdinus]
MDPLAPEAFAPAAGAYLNTAGSGRAPLASVDSLRTAVDAAATGGTMGPDYLDVADTARAAFARIAGVPADQVAVGSTVATHAALIAASLRPGAEVVIADGDFSSLVTPFAVRGDLTVRSVPLEEIADAVRPGTDLAVVSAVQSADGRLAPLDALTEACAGHGARTFVDGTQAVGWLPFDAGRFDYTATGAFKWLLCPRGVSFLTVRAELRSLHAGWVTTTDPYGDCYGPVRDFAPTARRYDEAPAYLPYTGAPASLALVERLGPDAIGAHNTALADRFRTGARELGLVAAPAPGSAIVSLPGLGKYADQLTREGIRVADRADGGLRTSFHLYNSAADVDMLLAALEARVGS